MSEGPGSNLENRTTSGRRNQCATSFCPLALLATDWKILKSSAWWLTYPSENYEFVSWDDYPIYYGQIKKWLVVWTVLKKLVSWDYYSQYMENTMSQTTNQWWMFPGFQINYWRYSQILKGSPIRWTQMDPCDVIRAFWSPCNIFNRCRTEAICRVGNEFLWIAELLLLSPTSTTWVLKPAGSHHHITTSPVSVSTQAPLPHPAARRRGVPCSPPLAHGPAAMPPVPIPECAKSWWLKGWQGGAPKIAKLAYNSNNYGLWYL